MAEMARVLCRRRSLVIADGCTDNRFA
jgi:hypothetical protein